MEFSDGWKFIFKHCTNPNMCKDYHSSLPINSNHVLINDSYYTIEPGPNFGCELQENKEEKEEIL